MPVFAHTADTLKQTTRDADSSAAELARIILQDAAMTSRVLKVSNSTFYNPAGRGINTISRAVVLLGFEAIRSLCLSIAMVESLTEGENREHVMHEMARAFHAAVQARAIAEKRKDHSPEEVFIATLLLNLGHIAFWCFGGKDAKRLEDALAQPETSPERAERTALGFALRDLTLGLSREWQLSPLLDHALEGKQGSDPRVGNILLGHELATLVEKEGWKGDGVKQLLQRIADTLYLPLDQVTKLVEDNAKQAAEITSTYGAGKASSLIPLPGAKPKPSAEEPAIRREVFPEPDPMLQLEILRELASSIEAGSDINLLIEMVLEGIARGIGMDRVLFAIITQDRRYLKARYSVGWDALQLKQSFAFDVLPESANIFATITEEGEAVWFGAHSDPALRREITEKVREVTGGVDFFAAPVVVNRRPIGLFYADRKPSRRPLSRELFSSFKHFSQQAMLGIEHITAAGKKRR